MDIFAQHNDHEGAFKGIFQLVSLNEKGEIYDYFVPVYDHPDMGEWVAGHWSYNTENLSAPRVCSMRTPRGVDSCPPQWVRWTLDVRGQTLKGDRIDGYSALTRIQKMTCNEAVDLKSAVTRECDAYDVQVTVHDAFAMVAEDTPAADTFVQNFANAFHDLYETEGGRSWIFSKWNQWKDEHNVDQNLDTVATIASAVCSKFGADADDIAERMLEFQIQQGEAQAKKARKAAKVEAKREAQATTNGDGVTPELRGLYPDAAAVNATVDYLRANIHPWHSAKCDDGVIRSVMAEGGKHGDNNGQLLVRLNNRLTNL